MEETTKMEETTLIQNELKRMLKEMILFDTKHEIDYSWSGIMGIVGQKNQL